ncbi:hypothetical protein V6N11_061102 [Hibiscus sabdariffa]|uniref:Secreted protein n=1 Tax=Hibiscus sabdariffa TaxID=183260 RepID=A0ABR2PIT2_9ROSI
MAACCLVADWCRAVFCRGHLLFLLFKFSSSLACKPPASALIYLPVLRNGAARLLCVWHCSHGPTLSLVGSWCGVHRLPRRMAVRSRAVWLPGPASLLAINLCPTLTLSLAYKFPSLGRSLQLLFMFE